MKLFSLALLLFSKSVLAEETTPENFAFAETQNIYLDIYKKLSYKYKSEFGTGTGNFAHSPNTTNPKDTSIPRPNFDTLYSAALIDFSTPLELTIGDYGRYQSVLVVTEDHYMPTFFINTNPGTFTLTKESIMANFAMLLARTITREGDEADKQAAFRVQYSLGLKQDSLGIYEPTTVFDQESLEEWKAYYTNILATTDIPSSAMFGPNDGTITQENHNVGVATGWGGNPPARAVYQNYLAPDSGPWRFKLKNVPVRAFWSVTVYDYAGFVATSANELKESYHLNSLWAVEEVDDPGVYKINFIDVQALPYTTKQNALASYAGWNFVLRLYEPEDKVMDGLYVPEIIRRKCNETLPEDRCIKRGCEYARDKDTGGSACQKFASDAKDLCGTFLAEETCNKNEGICIWESTKKGEVCSVFSCKDQFKEEDCIGHCEWDSKKGKCRDA